LKSRVLPQAEAKGTTWQNSQFSMLGIFFKLRRDLKIQMRLHKLPKNDCLGKVRSVDHDAANKPHHIPYDINCDGDKSGKLCA
jgi:hypothetical protein